MKKYEVRKFDIETKKGTRAEVEKKYGSDGVSYELVGSFDSFEEARKCYATVGTDVRKMSGYYLHECKELEINVYNKDDEYEYTEDSWDDLPCVENKLVDDVKSILNYAWEGGINGVRKAFTYAYEGHDSDALTSAYFSDLPEIAPLKEKIAETMYIAGEMWANGSEPDESECETIEGYLITKRGYDCSCGCIAWCEEKLPLLKDEDGEEYVDQAESVTYYIED
jgi:hypothetical protein